MQKDIKPFQLSGKSVSLKSESVSTSSKIAGLSTGWIQFIAVFALSIAWLLLSLNSGDLLLKEVFSSALLLNMLMLLRAMSQT